MRDQVDIGWSTFEQSYIQAFGPRLHEVVSAEFAQRDIDGHVGEVVAEVADGEARYTDGCTRAFDHLIAFPPYVSAVRYDALPADDRGFIETKLATRQVVVGHPDIYAPGDAGAFPVKQAFLAFLQADTVAEHIAADTGEHAFERPFDPVSMCIMEMFELCSPWPPRGWVPSAYLRTADHGSESGAISIRAFGFGLCPPGCTREARSSSGFLSFWRVLRTQPAPYSNGISNHTRVPPARETPQRSAI